MKNNIRSTIIFLGLAFVLVLGITFLVNSSAKNSEQDSTEKTPVETATSGEYTLADVAKHSKASDCWTIVRANVYDLTSWISKHPGGSQAIINQCGKDATAAFESQHGGQPKPKDILAGFEIGTYKK